MSAAPTTFRPPTPGALPSPRRPWLAAALWLGLLGPGFFVVYGWCNYVTSLRHDVGSFFFAWERAIPFVPWMIVPYVSIDLFFAGSFFLCRTRPELRVHARRIALAILISATCFFLFPLRYGWTRPAVDGWLGALFAPLNTLDQPYNLCPSLHISLRALLWRVYGRRTRLYPALHRLCWTWFVLIGLSTLLVYQHHVIDLLGGYLVSLLCRAMVREENAPSARRWPRAFWRRSSSSSPVAACAGSAASPPPANACTLPTTPATSTP